MQPLSVSRKGTATFRVIVGMDGKIAMLGQFTVIIGQPKSGAALYTLEVHLRDVKHRNDARGSDVQTRC
ncbi:hypothetical protein [Sulfurimonas sp. HSL3-7]|uniref:hypothetical protein n=1 Tax=Sulfonitrofixus jiaomeiensis TaxID=3131938 RepID=UPI0031F7D92F